MRQFIRHPTAIPIDYQVEGKDGRDRLKDLSHGGLCFLCREALPKGACLHISIPVEQEGYEADGVVRWCRAAGGQYEVGVEFEEAEAEFQLRMVEQVCHFEAYRKQVLAEEGRELSEEEAAQEWIAKNAGDFPR